MKKQGTVVRWDRERAFGFIRSPQIAADVFFHLRDYSGHNPPADGMEVSFDEIHVGGKGPRALSVEPVRNAVASPLDAAPLPLPPEAEILPKSRPAPRSRTPREKRREERPLWIGLGLIALWLLLWLIGVGFGRFPWVILTAVVIVNLATFYMYWRDKDAAIQESVRVPEDWLHGLGLAGGWPGGWFAQQILRHKTAKTRFQIMYWATVALNFAALLAWVCWPLFRSPSPP